MKRKSEKLRQALFLTDGTNVSSINRNKIAFNIINVNYLVFKSGFRLE
jgi:hypothetical protein